jgi:hypothetical protein
MTEGVNAEGILASVLYNAPKLLPLDIVIGRVSQNSFASSACIQLLRQLSLSKITS